MICALISPTCGVASGVTGFDSRSAGTPSNSPHRFCISTFKAPSRSKSAVEDGLARVSKDAWDTVILDPPRQGCPPDVIEGVFDGIRPPRAIYVSCNPDALAAELPVILKTGYRVARVQPIDMFPHTDHIETVMTFER